MTVWVQLFWICAGWRGRSRGRSTGYCRTTTSRWRWRQLGRAMRTTRCMKRAASAGQRSTVLSHYLSSKTLPVPFDMLTNHTLSANQSPAGSCFLLLPKGIISNQIDWSFKHQNLLTVWSIYFNDPDRTYLIWWLIRMINFKVRQEINKGNFTFIVLCTFHT